MAQYTLNYNLAKPLIGGDIDLWGQQWNVNADKLETALTGLDGRIDTLETDVSTIQGLYVKKDGTVSMTGYLTLYANPLVDLHAVTKQYADTNFLTKTGTTAQSVAPAVTFNNNVTFASGNTATFSGAAAFGGTVSFSGSASFSGNFSLTGGSFSATSNLSIVSGASERRVTLGSSGGYYYANATTAGWANSSGSDRISWNISTGAFTAAGDVTAFSDAKLKDDIRTIEGATDLVRKMRGVWFTRVDIDQASVGVIAQEMQKVVPEVVHDNDGTLSVAYGNLVGVLIETIKELDGRIKKLENR
jgi:hypothetical protein